jgi:hypothetical protein
MGASPFMEFHPENTHSLRGEYIEPNAYLNAAALAPYESLGSPVTIAPYQSYNVRMSAIPED